MARNHVFYRKRTSGHAGLLGVRQQPAGNAFLQRRQRVMTIQHDIKTSQNDLRTISTLVADAMGQFAKLFQNEIDLAKAELSDRVEKITGAAGLIAGGALLVIPTIVMAL